MLNCTERHFPTLGFCFRDVKGAPGGFRREPEGRLLPVVQAFIFGTQTAHKHKHFIGISLHLLGFIIRGFIWDIAIQILAYVVI